MLQITILQTSLTLKTTLTWIQLIYIFFFSDNQIDFFFIKYLLRAGETHWKSQYY